MKMMEKKLVRLLKPGQMIRLFGFVLAIFLGLAGVLYWQGRLHETGFTLTVIIALIAAVSFAFGVRIAQIDGFLDGYVRAKDEFEKKKKV